MTTETFIPTRYPYTYACDWIRQNPTIVPEYVKARAEAEEVRREGQGFGPYLSRAQASMVRKMWADATKRDDEELARQLADQFLAAYGIHSPRDHAEAESLHRDDLARDVARLWAVFDAADPRHDAPGLFAALDRLAAAYGEKRREAGREGRLGR